MKDGKTLTVCNASAGSGKTFSLAARYVACLLAGGAGSYRSILAVTFTNKATQEMRDRILTHLYALGQGLPDRAFLGEVKRCVPNLEESDIRLRCSALFEEMLTHYDDVRVMTIDSFLQLLLAGLAQFIGLATSYEPELDVKGVVSKAVDQIMSTHIDEQPGLLESISDFVARQLEDESSWDVRGKLRKLGEELLKEAVQERDADLQLDGAHIRAFEKLVDWKKSPEYQALQEAYAPLKDRSVEVSRFKYGNRHLAFLDRVEALLVGKPTGRNWSNGLGAGDLDYVESVHDALETAQARLHHVFTEKAVPAYQCFQLTTQHLQELLLLGYIRNRIRHNLSDANRALLAETASRLVQAMRPGDADFILEKAGIRFRHILLDEFQDTSTLQWENFRRLVEEILASGGSTLVVGDTKQSIYRFRNGNRHLMEGLTPAHPTLGAFVHEHPLRRNFRTRREIVRFNLTTFAHLPAFVETPDQKPLTLYNEDFTGDNLTDYYLTGAHEGGWVQLRAFTFDDDREAVREQMLDEMFSEIERLLREGAAPSDCMILVRFTSEGQEVIERYRQLIHTEAYPLLSQTAIVSSDSFQLDNSRSVNAAICGLKYVLRRDTVAQTFIRLCCPNADLEALDAIPRNLPLSEMLEDVIRAVLFPNGRFEGEDILYINNLRDQIRAYVTKNGSDAEALLTYWEDKMHEDAIGAAETQAIRLMTIHKAKGLEAKNVFLPFCDWPVNRVSSQNKDMLWCEPAVSDEAKQLLPIVPVTKSAKMPEAGYSREYTQELADEQIDNFNLLYVALTRAADRLFIYTDFAKDQPAKHVGWLLTQIHGVESELTAGDRQMPQSGQTRKESLPQPFSFVEAEPVLSEFHSGTGQVEFKQSQDSFQYTLHGSAEAQEGIDRRAFGTICHDILARSEKREDVTLTLRQFVRQGIIRDEALAAEVEQTLDRAGENEQMCDWFSGRWELMREKTILLPESMYILNQGADIVTEQRPDRVMICGDQAIVLDYKFGQMNERAYFAQVRHYMQLMRALGYARVEGYIWLAEEGKLIPVTPNTSGL